MTAPVASQLGAVSGLREHGDTLYSVALCIHVLAAVFGAGQLAAVVFLASTARWTPTARAPVSAILPRLLAYASRGLAALFISGVVLDLSTGRGYERTVWFRVSVLLLVGVGGLVGATSRALRTHAGDGGPAPGILRRVEGLGAAMVVLVALAVVLMELKPW